MPELHISNHILELPIDPILEQIALEWNCELVRIENGYVLHPEIMMSKHGVFIFRMDGGWKVCREEDATTWEDFLMMNISHRLASELGASLYYEGDKRLPVAPHKFATFDHYVETVVEHAPDLVKDMKKHWIYVHRKRSVR